MKKILIFLMMLPIYSCVTYQHSTNTSNIKYKEYFSSLRKSEISSDNEVFTNINSYSTNTDYNDWGYNPDNTTVNINLYTGYHSYGLGNVYSNYYVYGYPKYYDWRYRYYWNSWTYQYYHPYYYKNVRNTYYIPNSNIRSNIANGVRYNINNYNTTRPNRNYQTNTRYNTTRINTTNTRTYQQSTRGNSNVRYYNTTQNNRNNKTINNSSNIRRNKN